MGGPLEKLYELTGAASFLPTKRDDSASALTPQEWHVRFLQQASWTRAIRQYLLRRLELGPGKRALEVGCGTGVITTELAALTHASLFGIDLQTSLLSLAKSNDPTTHFCAANAAHLPYFDGFFHTVVCHYFLLWQADATGTLTEMRRVTHPGGWIVALAEPDYGGRIDYPEALADLGLWQTAALQGQGAAPSIGRRLASLFVNAGLEQVESGVMGGQWKGAPAQEELDSEWKMLEADLREIASPSRLKALRNLDQVSWQKGERILYVPTFYALGRVPTEFH